MTKFTLYNNFESESLSKYTKTTNPAIHISYLLTLIYIQSQEGDN